MAYKLTRRSALQGAGSLTMAAALPGRSARAAGYPDRPVKIIAPFAAGGPSDITARLMSVKLGEAFGQTFVIENRPGAGSNLGTVAVARITMPESMVRLSAGRESMSEVTQALCFMAGANSIFTGDKLLTAANAGDDRDAALFDKLGLRAMAAESRMVEAAE